MAVLVILLAGAGWFYGFRGGGGEAIDSVVVLPFVNAGGDPNAEYLSDGITESLINSLSQLPHLKVMSRDSAFMFKGKDTDAQVVGRQLGVRGVFKGRVMQRGDDLEISAELVDARDDSHIWGNQYSRRRRTFSPCRVPSPRRSLQRCECAYRARTRSAWPRATPQIPRPIRTI